jgi:hypothetical protein
VVERGAPDDLAAVSIDGREGEQPSALRERRELTDRADQFLATERGQVPGFTKLGIGKRRQDSVDVVE